MGTPDQILEKCSSAFAADPPVKTSYLEFGLPAALYREVLNLGVIPLINSHASVTSAHLDVGQYLVLAAINRVCEPRSKNGIAIVVQKECAYESVHHTCRQGYGSALLGRDGSPANGFDSQY
ncbi:MAG: hypothetical protein WBG50_27130 [Desulfomonilaceae bacterium]